MAVITIRDVPPKLKRRYDIIVAMDGKKKKHANIQMVEEWVSLKEKVAQAARDREAAKEEKEQE